MVAGLPADAAVAAGAFFSTNLDNALVAVAMVGTAPPQRAKRIVAGQATGFLVLVTVAAAAAIALFEVPARAVGLLGLIPLALGLRGLYELRHLEGRTRIERRAVGRGFFAAALITVAAGGDNLAVYIPLFRVAHLTGSLVTAGVFLLGEALLTAFILRAGQHPRWRGLATRFGMIATPLLFCAIGVVVLWRAGTLS
jgi:cadmium resistance protein CadD (predicted permease)